jgi:hypothetical protein
LMSAADWGNIASAPTEERLGEPVFSCCVDAEIIGKCQALQLKTGSVRMSTLDPKN